MTTLLFQDQVPPKASWNVLPIYENATQKEKELQNALVAKLVGPFGKPETVDIYVALREKYGTDSQPAKIWYFDPDFCHTFSHGPNQG